VWGDLVGWVLQVKTGGLYSDINVCLVEAN
jgi:hypothetical protein